MLNTGKGLLLGLGALASMPMLDSTPMYRGPGSGYSYPSSNGSCTKKGPGRHHKEGDGNKTHAARYYGRYSHVLTEHVTGGNRSKFKGFRKVRRWIPNHDAHPLHPNQGMSIWVPSHG